MVACSRALLALHAWCAHVLDVLAYFAYSRVWHADVLYELAVLGVLNNMTCFECFKK